MLPEQQQRIMGYFIEEAKDHLNTIEQGLLSLQSTIEDPEKANELFRAAHSVKGGAAMLGLESIQTTAHRMEDYFKVLKESPVQVDSALETMFLRISDGLKDLLEQLEGPFGLTQDKAQEIMAGVDPVFGQLAQHLDSLVVAKGSSKESRPNNPASADEALQTVFKRDVTALLRQLLSTFKQPDTTDSRSSIQETCAQLHTIGERFELPEWCDLVETARLAAANLSNEYRILAPVLIKEIKKSQELVLSGRASEVDISETMQSLLPEDILATADSVEQLGEEFEDTTFDLEFAFSPEAVETSTGLFGEEEEAAEESHQGGTDDDLNDLFDVDSDMVELSELAELDLNPTDLDQSLEQAADSVPDDSAPDDSAPDDSASTDETQTDIEEEPAINRVSLDLDFNEIPSELSALNRNAETEERVDESLDALLATVNVTGPAVGSEELTSLADLFDGDLEELDNTLGGHPFVSEEMRLHPESIDIDEQDDLTDFLLDESFTESAEAAGSEPSTDGELDDDLFGGTLTASGFADSSSLSLDSDLDEAFIEEASLTGAAVANNSETASSSGQTTPASSNLNDDIESVTVDIWGDSVEKTSESEAFSDEALFSQGTQEESAEFKDTESAFQEELGEEVAELETTYSGLGFATISQDELEASFVEDNTSGTETALEKKDDQTDQARLEGNPTVGLFSGESVSPSEQEIEFPTLTGVKLKKAKQDIDSFFLDILEEEANLSLPNNSTKDSSTESATQVVEDDPWGELSLDQLSSEAKQRSGDDALEGVLSKTKSSAVDNDVLDLNTAADEDLFEINSLSSQSIDSDIGKIGGERPNLGNSVERDTENEIGGKAEKNSQQSESLWDDLSLGAELEPSELEFSETDAGLEISSEKETGIEDFNNFISKDVGSDIVETEAEKAFEPEQALTFDELDLDSATAEVSVHEAKTSDNLPMADLLVEAEEQGEDSLDIGNNKFHCEEELIIPDQLFDEATESFNLETELSGGETSSENSVAVEEPLSTENETQTDSNRPLLQGLETEGLETEGPGLDSLEIESLELESLELDSLELESLASEDLDEDDSSLFAENLFKPDHEDADVSQLEGSFASATGVDLSNDAIDGTVSTLEDDALALHLSVENIETTSELLPEDKTASEEESNLDDFALEAGVNEFDDLDSLLAGSEIDDDSELSSSVGAQEESSTVTDIDRGLVSGSEEDEDFDDLEKLLEEGDETSLPAAPRRTAAPRVARRSSPAREQNMRVPVKHLDNLSNLVGELVVSRNTLERDQERLRQFLDNLLFQVQQLNDVGQRMRDLYERSLLESSLVSNRRAYAMGNSQSNSKSNNAPEGHATGATFDALEMDRFTGFHTLSQEMIELIVRVRESSSDIGYTVESSDQVTRQFRQITTQLQEGLNTARMVAFSQAADRLPRAVRDISLKCGKEAQLVVEGKDTLIDKMIVEHLYDPLTHLVNNAITHGIETPEARQAEGKPSEGTITVRAFYQGNQTVIYVADDGGGINPAFVQKKAVQKGLITQAEADELSDIETYDLLFHAGFSTRDTADDFAGRGVGMDVVRTSLAEIRVVITIDSEQGKGTSFTIRLPLTLSISKALSCVSNQARIAFPMDGVEDMLDVPRDRIVKNDQGQDCVKWRDRTIPFQAVTDLLKFNRTLGRGRVYGGSQDDDILSIIVLRSANTVVALQVDQVIGEEEIVIKQLEGPVPKPLGIAGATILGDGRVMPIADVLELIDIAMGRVRREPSSLLWAEAAMPEEEVTIKSDPTVLIVDDSITVRELLSMSFNKVGYRVEQARDGQEAWDKLRSGLPCDLVFCDIEMPRMDGLELLSRMQKDHHLKQVPIAMLTSRGADRHRQMAVDLGASGYFTKPYLEEALLDAAQRMLNGETLEKGRGG
ncbi:MAG: response regulator [Phormidesmis sp.]